MIPIIGGTKRAFYPWQDITGCQAFFNFDNVMTLSGSDITQVNDLSGNNRHAVRVAGDYAVLETNQWNGKNVAKNDALSNSFALTVELDLLNQSYFTFTCVFLKPVPATDSFVWSARTDTAIRKIGLETYGTLLDLDVAMTSKPDVTFTATTKQIATYVFDGTQSTDAAKMKLFLNGSQQTLSFGAGMPTTLSINDVFLGGTSTSGAIGFLGKLGAWGCWTIAMNTNQLSALHTFFGNYYGITVS